MDRTSLQPKLTRSLPKGFTLVELLVVITIIGILASLITVAAVGALRKARETETKTEIDQMATALDTYKDKATSYPPNCQTDDTATAGAEPATTPLSEQQVFDDLKRHMKQHFPRHQESDDLLRVLAGLPALDQSKYNVLLAGGMSAGEALVFWLGGFSADPKYPISGQGGPSYLITSKGAATNASEDPIETRTWTFPFDVSRLRPRDDDGFFDDSNDRFIEYTVAINGTVQNRRINFWQYVPRKSEQPYLYFDTSRYWPEAKSDPPAATEPSGLGPDGDGLHVHAFKKVSESAGGQMVVQYINPEKFQILHCGIDEEWGEDQFERMSVHGLLELNLDFMDPDDWLTFPEGPFIGEVADTIVNFTSATRVEDGQQ